LLKLEDLTTTPLDRAKRGGGRGLMDQSSLGRA
jgi:hypothetical protein